MRFLFLIFFIFVQILQDSSLSILVERGAVGGRDNGFFSNIFLLPLLGYLCLCNSMVICIGGTSEKRENRNKIEPN